MFKVNNNKDTRTTFCYFTRLSIVMLLTLGLTLSIYKRLNNLKLQLLSDVHKS